MNVLLSSFSCFCGIDLRLSEATPEEYRRKIARSLQTINKSPENVTFKDVRCYLKPFADGNQSNYENALKPLKAFFSDFMKMHKAVKSFKFKDIQLAPLKQIGDDRLLEYLRSTGRLSQNWKVAR